MPILARKPPPKRRMERTEVERECFANDGSYHNVSAEMYQRIADNKVRYFSIAVFMLLLRFKGTMKNARPSRNKLAIELGTSVRNITRAFDELEAAGLITSYERSNGGNNGRPSVFEIPLADKLKRQLAQNKVKTEGQK